MADAERQVRWYEAINAASEAHAYKLIRKAYYAKARLSTLYKTYLDVDRLGKRIFVELVRRWFLEDIEKHAKSEELKIHT